jgi:UDP-N-acetylglucosamine transferase subunit ALG13
MIFVTVGTQLPFDRLVRTVERWAVRQGRDDVFAQIGPPSAYRPTGIKSAGFLTAAECRSRIEQADLIISHAGMGTIISALELGKQLIVMPRRVEFREHRNDHQSATIAHLAGHASVLVAADDAELENHLANIAGRQGGQIAKSASPQLLAAIRLFVNSPRTAQVSGDELPLPD